MRTKKATVQTGLMNAFISIVTCLAAGGVINAQITRDVGHVAVIEGDGDTVFTPRDDAGNPCPRPEVHIDKVAKKFYRTHADEFQFLVMFTTFDVLLNRPKGGCSSGAGAAHFGVFNDVEGIGRAERNGRAAYGASKTLESFVHMRSIRDWPNSDTFLRVLGQEVGHRWAAYVQFDADPGPGISASNALLGRDNIHWSFFFHTASATGSATDPEASTLEGNSWEVEGPGQFRSRTVTAGYSPLDLYLMGLLPQDQVGQLWFIENPVTTPADITPESGPRPGVFAVGTQRFLTINDVIAVEGPRKPDYANSPKVFRQAFILLTRPGEDATQADLDRIEAYRVAWEGYFAEKTRHRGAALTNLRNLIFVDRANTGHENGSAVNPYNTIGEGRDNSNQGGTVMINAGRYPENLRLDKSLTLRAAGTVSIGKRIQ